MISAFIQKYVIYILMAVIALLLISSGVMGIKVWISNKTNAVLTSKVKEQEAQLSQRDALIEGFAIKAAEAEKKVYDANKKQSDMQSQHSQEMESLIAEDFPDGCQEASDFAITRIPKIVPSSWSLTPQ